jgi:hypothetical protein
MPGAKPIPCAAARNGELAKAVDNRTWRLALGDVADVDEITYTTLPPHYNPNPTAQGAGNPLITHALTFIREVGTCDPDDGCHGFRF